MLLLSASKRHYIDRFVPLKNRNSCQIVYPNSSKYTTLIVVFRDNLYRRPGSRIKLPGLLLRLISIHDSILVDSIPCYQPLLISAAKYEEIPYPFKISVLKIIHCVAIERIQPLQRHIVMEFIYCRKTDRRILSIF